jgi:hypothetical protein
MPRTTLTLDDDVLAAAKRYAKSRSISLGEAVTDLVRRGVAARRGVRQVNRLLVFDLPPESPRITPQQVKLIESDEL